MRAFAIFLGLILAGLAALALFAYPAWLLLHPHFDFPFHRIAGRIGMLALLIGFVLVARRLRVADRASLGYGLPRRDFFRALLQALALGVAMMLPVVALMALLGLRSWRPDLSINALSLGKIALQGLATGLTVAFIEETFLRGAMFTAIQRESGARATIILTALVYSATHFFARYHIDAEAVSAGSGLDLLVGTLHTFADPLAIADAFLCLFAVGVVLGMVRAATGNIAACIGLHAGWVWIITFIRETSQPNREGTLGFLVSQFDGVVGWLLLAWTIVMGFALHRFYATQRPVPHTP